MEPTSPMIPLNEAAQAVNDMTRRVALLHLAFARTLVEELGEEKGRELILKSIQTYGQFIGEATRQRVETRGLQPVPENFGAGSDLSPIGFDTAAVTVNGEKRSRIFNCALAGVWKEYGEEKLGRLYCQVDPAKMQAYHASTTIVHVRNILEGDSFCEQAVRPLEE